MTEAIERRVAEALDGLSVPWERLPIDPAFADTAQFCAQYGVPLDRSANTILVASKKEPRQYAACVVRATRRLDVNHAVRQLMGVSRLSFVSAEETQALTGMALGGVTVFALPPELPVYVDATLLEPDWIILGSGSRSSKIKVAPRVLERVPNARVVAGLTLAV
ncbi:MAG: hypothetical protein A2W08_13800 [Candidatus Rokubacteria bacterium RBG_16_73_20]|nr:MAG: hypothetical protein A2W08_13800 [Candidatus Rokubacteria bacterium RBG_16_73_20]HBH01568.1 hypothetical protein [Candidatus Rokubacteria bacterium]